MHVSQSHMLRDVQKAMQNYGLLPDIFDAEVFFPLAKRSLLSGKCQHSGADGRDAASQRQRPGFDPDLGCRSCSLHVLPVALRIFLPVVWFPLASRKLAGELAFVNCPSFVVSQ